MTAAGPPQSTRRAAIRRHRRERQVLVFGLLLIALGVITFGAMGVYKGTFSGPFNAPFVTPQAEFTSDVTLPCPPNGSLPMQPDEVAIRVLNGTDKSGLAGNTLGDLVGRGFVGLGATNWTRDYDGTARIMFGESGLHKAYTVALQFTEAELVLDDRKNATVDVVLGKAFTKLVSPLDPQLDPETPLAAGGACLPVGQVDPEPAPRIYPADPLASVTPSPSPSASPSE